MFGFGPPSVRRRTTPNVANATFWTSGLFAQGQFHLTPRLELGAGLRGQTIGSRTQETVGLPADRAGVSARGSALVGQVNGQYELRDGLNFVVAVGRAFRAPNLIERYFIAVTNLANALYAEASNTAFSRPEPPRSVMAAMRFDF